MGYNRAKRRPDIPYRVPYPALQTGSIWPDGPYVRGLFREGKRPRGGLVILRDTRSLGLTIAPCHMSIFITTSGQ